MSTPAPAVDWSFAKRFGFRFAFAYLLLYNLPFPIGATEATEGLETAYRDRWHPIVQWVGARVLHLAQPITVFPNGSGDTTYNYVQLLCYCALALIAAVLWSILDSRRRSYEVLLDWLRIYVRSVLACTMMSYGLMKVFKLQFAYPDVTRLIETYGDSSPMGLLWTFMGYSKPYTNFAGACELIGGVLLISRRTAELGALLLVAVIGNVALLNFCYDVPVKLYSSHLCLMALFLAAPALPRLANLLVFHRPAEPASLAAIALPTRWMRSVALVIKLAFFGYCGWSMTTSSLQMLKQHGDDAPKHELYGLYEAEEPQVSPAQQALGRAMPRVSQVAIGTRVGMFKYADGTSVRSVIKLLPAVSQLAVTVAGNAPGVYRLAYSRPDPEHLSLEGDFTGGPLRVTLKKRELSTMTLTGRGFHWINEHPYNR